MIMAKGVWRAKPAIRWAIACVSVAVLPVLILLPGFQVLEIGGGKAKVSLSVSKGDVFAHGYTHSMYGVPVVEKFRIERGGLRLFHVMTESDGAREYFGIEKKGENNADAKFTSFSIPVASVGGHVLSLDGRRISLETLHAGTGAITVTLGKRSLAAYLMTHLWR